MLLEQQVRRNDAEMEEEEFWQNELQIEQESERQLRHKLAELQVALRDCEAKLAEYLARVQVSGDATDEACVKNGVKEKKAGAHPQCLCHVFESTGSFSDHQ